LELTKILCGSTDDSQLVAEGDDLFGLNRAPEQSLLRIVELFHTFDFDWEESLTTTPETVDLVIYRSLNLMGAVGTDLEGRPLIDRDVLLQMLREVKLQTQANLMTPAGQERL
jgi:nuclear pore complex protein Nup205